MRTTTTRPIATAVLAFAAFCTTATGLAGATPTPAPDPTPAPAPAEYVAAAEHSALQCDQPNVTTQLLLAEVRFASGFTVDALSAAGAQGPAQLLPITWATYGADDDGNGTASPYDIVDALGALARLNCTDSRELAARGHDTDPVTLIAAWYGGRASVDSTIAREPATQAWNNQLRSQR